MSGHTTVSAFKEKLDMEHIMKQIAKCIVMFPVYILHFYTPVKDGLYYVVLFVRPSVHPSVRLSVSPLTFHVHSLTLIPLKIFS